MFLTFFQKFDFMGFLILRVGLGMSMAIHGIGKLLSPAKWEMIGSSTAHLGITFAYSSWGLMAGLTEAMGGILFALGFWFRPTSLLLAFTMFVAAVMHLKSGHGFNQSSHAIELFIVFFGFVFIGPGKSSIDGLIKK